MTNIVFKLGDIKLESSEAYLLQLGKKSVAGILSYLHFSWKGAFKYMQIFQTVLDLQFNKQEHLYLGYPPQLKIEIGKIAPAAKRDSS